MSKTSGLIQFLNFIGKLLDYRIVYTNIKNDPDLKPYSKYFAGKSILNSILFLILSLGGSAMVYIGFTRNLAVIFNIFVIIMGFGFVIYSIGCFFLAFSATIKQIKLNRRPMSWIALLLFLVCLGLFAFGMYIILKKLHL